ncbi:Protein LITTLE ZIPPER 2 [Linum perenne]
MCFIRETRPLLDTSSKRRKLKLQVIGLTRRRCGEGVTGEKDMELKNLKLFMENRTIYEANEKLRERACLLHLENLALLRELQEKLPHLDHNH